MRKTIHNLSFVTLSQLLNLLVPLIVFPYLVKTLGVETFGKWSIILSVTTFFQIITNYDFRSTHTRAIIENINDRRKQLSVFTSSLIIKLILIISCLIIFFLINKLLIKSDDFKIVFFINLMIFGNGLDCFWIYQSIEKLYFHSIIISLSKLVNLGLIFLLVVNQQSLPYLVFSFGLVTFLSNLVLNAAFLWSYRVEIYEWKKILKNSFSYLYKKGDGYLMFSNLGISTYTNLKGVLMSKYLSPYEFGIFSIIEKVLYFIQVIPLGPLMQVIYPKLVKESIDNKGLFYQNLKKNQNYTTLIFVLYCLSFLSLKSFILETIFHVKLDFTENIVFFILMLNAIITNSTAFLIQYFLVEQYLKDYFLNHFYPAFLGLILIMMFSDFWGIIGGSIGVLITSSIIVIYTHFLFYIKYENSSRRLGI